MLLSTSVFFISVVTVSPGDIRQLGNTFHSKKNKISDVMESCKH